MFELESEIEGHFKRCFDRKFKKPFRGLCLKLTTPGFIGVPDRLILLSGGIVAFAELKNTGKKERKRQEYVQKKLRALGFKVFSAVDTKEKADEVIRYCEEVLNRIG